LVLTINRDGKGGVERENLGYVGDGNFVVIIDITGFYFLTGEIHRSCLRDINIFKFFAEMRFSFNSDSVSAGGN